LDCSILICTRNRAAALENTLRAFASVRVPDGWRVEMIVADNGSTDQTPVVVANASHPSIAIRYLAVPTPGKSRAQNAALSCAMGKVLLFTDDDVEPSDNWLESMAGPLLENRCDAVAGRILLADELRRPWMTPMHARWLADVREPAAEMPELVGASMGIRRAVFERIGHFDEDLGPGVTGFGEETLLWMQMKEAGMRILPVADTHVVHHPDPSRLRRENWLHTPSLEARQREPSRSACHLDEDETRRQALPADTPRSLRRGMPGMGIVLRKPDRIPRELHPGIGQTEILPPTRAD
jgi:glycosyltransferase involved in cell wall biosynthesis